MDPFGNAGQCLIGDGLNLFSLLLRNELSAPLRRTSIPLHLFAQPQTNTNAVILFPMRLISLSSHPLPEEG